MCVCVNLTTNANGIPGFRAPSVTVGTESVDLGLGFRNLPPVGVFTIILTESIPADTTGTLPVRLTLNGRTRNLTNFGGTNVTASQIIGTGVLTVYWDWYSGTLQVISPTITTA